VLDYDIVRIIRPIIINGLTSLNIDANVLLNYQPTKQGINENTVYLFNVGDNDIGFMGRNSKYDKDQDKLIYKELQVSQTTFQINTILKQGIENLTITAKDLCNYVKMILQSTETINILKVNNLEILRISNIINTPFTNGADNYQYNPSFDFVIIHTQELEYNINKIDKVNQTVKEV
tara:strand:- start:26044 stop:26574 length:531 start_codon:yes stop_codon:yes gene_type:complete